MKRQFSYASRQGAFTLVELLAVIVLIAILVAISLPLLSKVKGANNLTFVADDFNANVNFARQRASTIGKNVAIRLYKVTSESSSTIAYRSFQIWEQKDPTQDPSVNGTAWVAVSKRVAFRPGIIALDAPTYSALLTVNTSTETYSSDTIPFSAIIFTPAGRVDLPLDKNFITFVQEGPGSGGPGLPANFATVSIEPFNARPFLFRP